MRTLLVFILFISTLLLSGQTRKTFNNLGLSIADINYDNEQREIDEIIKEALPLEFLRIDSLINYYFLTDVDTVPYLRSSNVYLGNKIEITYSRKPYTDSSWVFDEKKIITLYATGEQESYFSYKWRNDMWAPEKKDTYTYEEDSKIITRYDWNLNGDYWEPTYKFFSEYDAFGREIRYINHNWDVSMSNWKNNSKGYLTYDANGNTLDILAYSSFNSNTWVMSRHDSSSYENGKRIYFERSYWDNENEVWENNEKSESTYENEDRTTETYYWANNSWNLWSIYLDYELVNDTIIGETYRYDEDSNWYQSHKSKYILYDANRTLFNASYSKQDANKEWIGTNKSESKYNQFNSIDMSINYIWDHYSKSFVKTAKREYSYNDDGIRTYSLTSVWNVDSWEKYENSVYYYSSGSSIGDNYNPYIKLVTFPNPTSGIINWGHKNLNNVAYTITDVRSRVIRTGLINSNSINIRELQSGIYFIFFVGSSTGSHYYSKIIKK